LYLKEKDVDRVLSIQILRSGTSIGANAEEAMGGSSKKDLKQKLRIAYREARETSYWLRLLKESELLEPKLAESILADCTEIIRIFYRNFKLNTRLIINF
jgi:four helix bundle protein